MIGSILSHYRILEKIGEGGMGAVYLAEDIKLKRTVALKFLPLEVLGDERERERFVQEAQTEASLDHHNICTVYEIEEAEGRLFIAMAFVHGRSLKERIESDRPDLAEAIDIAIQIGEGLQAAHEKEIVHRDIKPANIMLAGKGTVKILDFGLASLTDTMSTTREGPAAGTLSYMSPEQVCGGAVDHRTDIWSLGTILYEMVTGIQPFRTGKEYDAAVMYSIVNEEPDPPSMFNDDVIPQIDSIARRALKKDANRRYTAVSDMLADLRSVKNALGATEIDRFGDSMIKPTRRVSLRATVATSITLTAIFLLIAFVIAPLLQKDTATASIAVMDFTNDTSAPHFSNLLAKLLMTDLGQSSDMQVLSGRRMEELCARFDYDLSRPAHAFALCREAHVRYLVQPVIRQGGELFTLWADVYVVATERKLFDVDAGPGGQEEIVAMVDGLSISIKAGLRGGVERDVPDVRPDRRLSEITTASIEAYMFYDIGQSLYAGHDPLKAIPHVERAVDIDSTFVEAYYFLSILYDYIGNRDGALRCAHRAADLTRNGGAAEVIKSAIFVHWVSGEWDEAIEYMKRYLELKPHDTNMRQKLGYILSRYKNKLDEAIIEFENIIERDPHNLSGRLGTVYNFLGKAYLFSGRSEKAMEAYMRYQTLVPDKPDPLNSRAHALHFLGRYDEAIALHQQVIQKYPRYYIGYKDLGLTYQAVGMCEKARTAFRRFLNTAPDESLPGGHVLLGKLHVLTGDAAAALAEAETALTLDTLSLEARALRGTVALNLLGDTEAARKELLAMENLLADGDILEDIHHYHFLRGLVLLAEKRFDDGLDVLRNEIETAPRDFSIFLRKELVRGCIGAGRTNQAIRAAAALLELTPNDGELNYLAGISHREAGEDREADTYFRRARRTWRNADAGFPPLDRLISQLEK